METTITELDKPTVRYIRDRLRSTLDPLAQELGIVIDFGNFAFRRSSGRVQLRIALRDSNGQPITEEIEAFRYHAILFGFKATDLGKQFIIDGQPYTICGLNRRSRKYPIIARSENGDEYKFSCGVVLQALGRIPPLGL